MAAPNEESMMVDTMIVADGRQQEAIAAFEVLFAELREVAGFIDAQLFQSVDGTVLLSYAQLSSEQVRQAAERRPGVQAALRSLRAIGHTNAHTYRLILKARAGHEPQQNTPKAPAHDS